MGGAVGLLIILHLIPLPYAVWSSLPGRSIIAQIDSAIGAGEVWRPLSMVPTATWNSLYSLSVPAALFTLLIQLNKRQQTDLLTVVAGLICLSAFLGLIQATTDTLKFFAVSSPSAGLFANRNHQAVVLACAFPMLAVFGSQSGYSSKVRRFRQSFAIAISLVLVPLILVTGSRAGMAATVAAIGSTYFLLPEKSDRRGQRRMSGRSQLILILLGLAAVLALSWIALQTGRNVAFIRIREGNIDRIPVWIETIALAKMYFPVGSGIGSFVEVFQLHEPTNMVQSKYWNHAHNDWLEVVMTGGLPGVVLLFAAVGAFGLMAFRSFVAAPQRDSSVIMVRLSSVIIGLLGLASVFDYPLRTPAAACLFIFAAVIGSFTKDGPSPSV